MNLHRLDLVSLSLFNLVARTGSIGKGAEPAHLAVGGPSCRTTRVGPQPDHADDHDVPSRIVKAGHRPDLHPRPA